jgi:hypothetical protein
MPYSDEISKVIGIETSYLKNKSISELGLFLSLKFKQFWKISSKNIILNYFNYLIEISVFSTQDNVCVSKKNFLQQALTTGSSGPCYSSFFSLFHHPSLHSNQDYFLNVNSNNTKTIQNHSLKGLQMSTFEDSIELFWTVRDRTSLEL